ncbi:MAG: glycosyltransferase family 2 protein [Candidatus Omnitrophica bacterium]|nr:glycosyltransferase family 2 protein [Candidatus Omnitrophota bacterium]
MQEKFNISFVMPMYNEEANIEKTISTLILIAEEVAQDFEIVVVDDASTDSSAKIVKSLSAKENKIKFFQLEKNTMFGGAFAECFKKAEKDIIVYMDSDMPVDQKDIKSSIPLIKNYSIVTGISKIKKGDTIFRKLVSMTYNFVVRILFGLNVKDINSGYKIVKKDFVKDLKFISKSPFIDVELFLHARKKRAQITQYPLIFQPREGGKSYIASTPIMLATVRDMLKVLYSYRLRIK